ncbi:hypothetical protein HMSSN036_07620 [Paenibacillus macerans]|nr:hypothetical protein HMSSN036_07620 [Paenibacillus macerans]
MQQIFHLLNSEEETREIDVQINIASIWRTLYLHQQSCMELPQTAGFLTTQERLRLMLEFIYENYTERIRLADIASAAKVSTSEALRCFKEGADASPVDYLIQFRLNKARELLQTTEIPLRKLPQRSVLRMPDILAGCLRRHLGSHQNICESTSVARRGARQWGLDWY